MLFSALLDIELGSKIYDQRDDFDFDMVNFPFLDGDENLTPRHKTIRTSTEVSPCNDQKY